MSKFLSRIGALAGFSAAVALVVVLALQKQRLEDRYNALRERLTSPQPGFRLPWVPARTLAGESVTLGRPDSARLQILFFYTTTCPHCRVTVPAWNSVAQQVADAEVLGVQLDSPHRAAAYRDSVGLRYSVVPFDSALAVRVTDWYRIGGVPLTIVADHDGRATYARRGRIETPEASDSIVAAALAAVKR